MPETKNPSETVDTGNPGKNADKDAKRSAGDSHGEPEDKGSVGRKPGEADAPRVPEKAKPSFE